MIVKAKVEKREVVNPVSVDALVEAFSSDIQRSDRMFVCRETALYDLEPVMEGEKPVPVVYLIPPVHNVFERPHAEYGGVYFPAKQELDALKGSGKPFWMDSLNLRPATGTVYLKITPDHLRGLPVVENKEANVYPLRAIQEEFIRTLFNGSGEGLGEYLERRKFESLDLELADPHHVERVVSSSGPFVSPAVFYHPDNKDGKFFLSLYKDSADW